MPVPAKTALTVLVLGLAPLSGQAQITLDPSAVGKVSFATEAITGQSPGASSAVFGTVDGYTNQLISAGHGLANLGAPTDFGNTSGTITNHSLSFSAAGPSPFGSGQVTFNAGDTGMGSGVLWSSYALNGAPGTSGLVSLLRANGSAAFTNTTANTLNIWTGVSFGLQGTVGVNDIAGGALAARITVGSDTFTPYIAMGFDGSSATGFVEPGFIGVAAPDADLSSTFQQSGGMFTGVGDAFFYLSLLSGQTFTIDTTLTLFSSGSAELVTGPPVPWKNPPPPPPPPDPDPAPDDIFAISSTTLNTCPPTPEPGSLALGAALSVLLAGHFRKRASTLRQRQSARQR